MKGHLELSFSPDFWFKAGVLCTKFVIVIVFGLDHIIELLLLLVVPEEVVFKLS